MRFNNFDEMIKSIKMQKSKKQCAVVAAESEHTLEAVLKAYKEGLIEPVLIGNEFMIREYLEKIISNVETMTIIPTSSDEEAAQKAVDLIHAGKADCLMKGRLETRTLMSAVLSSKNKLKAGKLVSSIGVWEVPGYHKLLFITDGGITLYPNLTEKKLLIDNAVEALIKLGVPCPKVAVLAAIETVNPKMRETVDAAELKEMNKRGEIKNCIVEGPISFDCAFSKEAAQLKGYESPVAGDPDLLVWPDIASGNIAGKAMICVGHARVGLCILGTKVPIIVSSRSATTDEKYLSIVFASALAQNLEKK